MNSGRDRNLSLSDPGRDTAGDELERIIGDAEAAEESGVGEDAGFDSFLERFPVAARERRTPE